tara:strand:+ start:269 stop:475 length:207 start_codon:yes stop_codon:yes gene_type:complete
LILNKKLVMDIEKYIVEIDGKKYIPYEVVMKEIKESVEATHIKKLDDAIKTLSNELSSVKPDLSKLND